jgi:uncharacterized repeat protein (TIGR01451 family)
MLNKKICRYLAPLIILAALVFPVAGHSEICGVIDTAGISPESTKADGSPTNYAWITQQKFYMAADSSSAPQVAPLRIFENGVEIGPAHSLHADIRSLGAGRFSYWNNWLYFSTSDNSDPRTNGRTYEYGGVCMPTFTVAKVDDVPTGYGTFSSHNQKLVQNAYGLFMTYSYAADNDTSGNETWRLARSLDGGKTWATIWRGMTVTRAPILETDAHGSIYIVHSNELSLGDDGAATFYRFDPEKSFSNPLMKLIPGGSAGKFTGVWDEVRQRLYYMTWDTWHFTTWDDAGRPIDKPNNNFFALDRDGNFLFQFPLTCQYVIGDATSSVPTSGCITRSESDSFVHYPQLEIDGTRLYAAWTTSPRQDVIDQTWQRYRAIFYIYSEDGGATWRAPGTAGALTTPIIGNEHGPARMVNLIEELSLPDSSQQYSLWLWNFVSKGGYLHFAYDNEIYPLNSTYNPPAAPYVNHYMRFSAVSGARNIDVPNLRGQYITTNGSSGFFATGPSVNTPLFIATNDVDRLAILSSPDLGQSWSDVAISNIKAPTDNYWYAISGNRRLTRTGDIIGHATTTPRASVSNAMPAVHFFRYHVTDRTNEQGAQWVFVSLDTTKAVSDGGYGYRLPMTGVDFGSDTSQNMSYSKLRLFENGIDIGLAHSYHADIRSSGGGRFSHWMGNTLYFSASDNSDPRTNGKTYQVAFPSTEAQGLAFYGKIDATKITFDQGNAYAISTQFFGINGDSTNDPVGSSLLLYEDGVMIGPAHTPLDAIRVTGRGEYLHWQNTLYFSTSDNTDPRTNGRSYTFTVVGGVVSAVGEDLAVTITASPNSVRIGNYITYTLKVTNNGPATASSITLTDNLGGATFIPSGSSSNCAGAGTVSCTINGLASGASATLTIVAAPVSSGSLNNTAVVTEMGQLDFNPANNIASIITNVQAALSVSVSGTGGGTVISAPSGINCGTTCLAGFDAGTLVTLTASPDAGYAARWSGCDTATGNSCTVTMSGSKSVIVSFDKLADLSVALSVNPTSVPVNDYVNYTATITNNGPATASAVTFTDVLPAGLTWSNSSYTKGTGSAHACSASTCSIGSLDSGATAKVNIFAMATGAGTIVNTASVSNVELDSNTANNSASASITVTAAAPDLYSTTISASKSGSAVNVSDTVKNQGNAKAGSFTVSYYLSTDASYGAGDLALVSASGGSTACTRIVTSLDVGKTDSKSKSCYKPTATKGTYYVLEVVDSGGKVTESNETNNTRVTTGTLSW